MRALALLLALLPAVFAVDAVRQAVESRMLWHMLGQFPLLLASGATARMLLRARWLARVDAGGLLGVVLLSAVSALWMVPLALDAALMDTRLALFKYASWWAAGFVLADSWPRMAPAMRLFLLGNLAWMLATAGLLYLDAEQRLCVSYLQDEQLWTGRGLLLWAFALLALLLRQAYLASHASASRTHIVAPSGINSSLKS